jgi:hypothetical protein
MVFLLVITRCDHKRANYVAQMHKCTNAQVVDTSVLAVPIDGQF